MSKKHSLLIVDADQLFLNFIQHELSKRRCKKNVELAGSVKEALHKAAQTKFETILIDLFMSRLSGLQLAKEIQRRYDNTKIILLLKEEYQPVIDKEFGFPIVLETHLLEQLLRDC